MPIWWESPHLTLRIVTPPVPGLPSLLHEWEPPRAVSVGPGLTCILGEELANPPPHPGLNSQLAWRLVAQRAAGLILFGQGLRLCGALETQPGPVHGEGSLKSAQMAR